MKKIRGLLILMLSTMIVTGCGMNPVAKAVVTEGKEYNDKKKVSDDLDTVEEIVTTLKTVYSDLATEGKDITGAQVRLTTKGLSVTVTKDASVAVADFKTALEDLGIHDSMKLKSKKWGEVTITVMEGPYGPIINVESDGDENIAEHRGY